jgi:hypothetical protein
MSSICRHGLTDNVQVTDETVIKDYRYGTQQTTWGYWCLEHQQFGLHSHMQHNVDFKRSEKAPLPAA